jgi:hypothetical protein
MEGVRMSAGSSVAIQETRRLFDELRPGDRIEIERLVSVGARQWTSVTTGKVYRVERRRHGLHFQRNFDDRVYSDVILLELPDGELTDVTIDEFTVIRRR